MSRQSPGSIVGRSAAVLRRALGDEIRRLRTDANLSQRQVSIAANVNQGYLSEIEAGRRVPGFAVLVAIGRVLGADLRIRLYPTTGPRIHDRIQAAIVEELLRSVHPRWKRLTEVPIHRPSRGFIDIVLALPASGLIVAGEVQSEIRRVEQQLRWAVSKAESLPSADAWPTISTQSSGAPSVSRLLVLRSSRTTRDIVRTYQSTFRLAYPACAADVYRALTSADAPWPGPGILWAAVENGTARLLATPPRGVAVGR